MKTILATLVLLLSVNATAAAKTIPFDTVRVNGKQKIARGKTTIDRKSKTIRVDIQKICPQDLPCIETVESYEVPLEKVSNDGCATYTQGQDDMRPVDGPLVKVTVEDNSKNTCETGGIVESLYKTTIELEVVSRTSAKTIHTVIELTNRAP